MWDAIASFWVSFVLTYVITSIVMEAFKARSSRNTTAQKLPQEGQYDPNKVRALEHEIFGCPLEWHDGCIGCVTTRNEQMAVELARKAVKLSKDVGRYKPCIYCSIRHDLGSCPDWLRLIRKHK